MFCACPRKCFTNSTAPPKHWWRPIDHGISRIFPEVGILKTEPLADAEAQETLWSTSEKVSIDEDLGMVLEGDVSCLEVGIGWSSYWMLF